MLSKVASSTIFWVFGMTRPGIESRSLGPLANTQLIRSKLNYLKLLSKWFNLALSDQKNLLCRKTKEPTNRKNQKLCNYVKIISMILELKYIIVSKILLQLFVQPIWVEIIIVLLLWEFFTLALADGFSVEFEWLQVSSSLQDSSQYSRWF